MPSRQEALDLLHEYVKSESLRKHCLAIAYAMEAYAKHFNENKETQEKWFITGLLHDFDYEKYPCPEKHPFEGIKILKSLNYPDDITEAILGHAEYSGVERKSLMAKCLFAVDELCGLIIALAYVRPGKFEGMSPKSLEKAMKKKGFAHAINRNDIEKGIKELGVKRDEHFLLIIKSFKEQSKELGF